MDRKRFFAALAAALMLAAPVAAQVVAPGAANAPGGSGVIPEKVAPPLEEGRSVAPAANPDAKKSVDPNRKWVGGPCPSGPRRGSGGSAEVTINRRGAGQWARSDAPKQSAQASRPAHRQDRDAVSLAPADFGAFCHMVG
jgi:hypothetical protein